METPTILAKLLNWCRISFPSFNISRARAPEPIESNETLSRFIFDKDYFRGTQVKASAFLPAKDGATSVFRKSKMSTTAYQNTCKKLAEQRNRQIKASALFQAECVQRNGLKLEPEESEFKWHADIVQWPDDKSKRKALAQALAQEARIE